jgi:hypothetical protein
MAYPSTVAQIETALSTLASTYHAICTRFETDHSNHTYEGSNPSGPGRIVSYLRIGTGVGDGRVRVLLVSGVHAREFAPPDALLTFVSKLLAAYTARRPIEYAAFTDSRSAPSTHYRRFTIPFPDVERIIEKLELYILPVANPDGRAFAQSSASRNMWRKNRRPRPVTAVCVPPENGVGVDINRNFDVGWDFNKYYSAAAIATMNAGILATLGVSADPCDFQVYHGPAPVPASSPRDIEPETRNIMSLLNDKDIEFYMDVHSAAGAILFPWGLEQNQETNAEKTFKNPGWDRGGALGERDGVGLAYKEWMPPGTEARHQSLGNLMRSAILDSTGFSDYDASNDPATHLPRVPEAVRARTSSNFDVVQSPFLFGPGSAPDFEPGGSDDFAFSRQIGVNPGPPLRAIPLTPVFSFTFESGRATDGGFHPDAVTEYPKVEREVGAGLGAFLAFASSWRHSSSWCFVATAAYGSELHAQVRFLCDLRDREVKTTEVGVRFMRRFERIYYSFSPQLADHLRRHTLTRRAVRALVVAPAVAVVRAAVASTARIDNAELRVRCLLTLVVLGLGAGVTAVAAALYLLARAAVGV